MSYGAIALLMFTSMMVLLATGQRMYGVIGFVGIASSLALWGPETASLPFDAAITTLNWYPLLTLPMFVFMGYMFAETGIAGDLYRMFHVLSGLLLAALFAIYILIRSWIQPNIGPALPQEERLQITWKEKFSLLRAGIIPLVIFISMTGLFLAGITSLVESSGIGMLATTLAALIKRRLTWNALVQATRKTLGVSAVFMWIIQAALLFSAVFDGLGAGKALEEIFIKKWDLSPWAIVAMMQASFLLMGTFLDDTAMLVIVAPLYVPLIIKLGFDPVWYGVLYTITCQIAYMTPPFGYNLFLMRAMAPPEITLADIYRSIVPFVLVMIVGLVIVMMFPQLATYLPSLYFGR